MAMVHDSAKAFAVTSFLDTADAPAEINEAVERGDVRVLLIDPSPLSRSCLLAGFRGNQGISITAYAHVEELPATLFEDGQPDVIILQAAGQDLASPQFNENLKAVNQRYPRAGTMLLSGPDQVDQMLAGLHCGICAYITSDLGLVPTIKAIELMRDGLMVYPQQMLSELKPPVGAIIAPPSRDWESDSTLLTGDEMLTPRQQDVLRLLARGLSNKAIAAELDISESTVKVHIRAIMERTGMLNRTQIVAHFFRGRH